MGPRVWTRNIAANSTCECTAGRDLDTSLTSSRQLCETYTSHRALVSGHTSRNSLSNALNLAEACKSLNPFFTPETHVYLTVVAAKCT